MYRSRRRRVHPKPELLELLHGADRQVTDASAASNLQELLQLFKRVDLPHRGDENQVNKVNNGNDKDFTSPATIKQVK
jgi:hypothetical protein